MNLLGRYLWYLVPANPIVVRIVQGGSRRARDLWVRMGYLGGLIALVMIGLISSEAMGKDATITDLAKSGTKVFALVAYGQVVLVCLIAPLFMAGAINQERQSETFDILLTTPLSNLQIVLGSLLSRLFFIITLLMSGLPLFAVLLVFGGVPIHSVFVAFAVAGCTAVFVGSVAVLLSVLRTGGRKAVYVFIICVAGYLVGSYAVDQMIRSPQAGSASAVMTTTWVTPLHPLLVLEASINNANYKPPTVGELQGYAALSQYYLSNPLRAFALITVADSLVLLLFSATQVRRIGTGEPLVPLPKKLRSALRLASPGERTRTPRTVRGNPIAWKESHSRGKVAAGIIAKWAFLIIGVAMALVLVLMYHNHALPLINEPNGGAAKDQARAFRMGLSSLLLLEISIISMVAIYMSAGCVSKEREDGTLDLLLTTPITQKQYVWGKLRGLVTFLSTMIAVPVATMAIVCAYMAFAGDDANVNNAVTIGQGRDTVVGKMIFPEAVLLLPLFIVPFVALCVAVGVTFSIKARGVLGAVLWSISGVGAFALVMGFCGMNAMTGVPTLGALINAFSPSTNIFMLVNPWDVDGFADNTAAGRINIFIGALLAAAAYSGIVYAMVTSSVKNFDLDVRRLSGTA